ncbi:histone-lysine N-methyltransferase [Parastagonospora nodorum]|nr:histone-lysine N-methyltransferase [Parastagonospora nodorum]KAH4212127.1 histone-lysine N-methyltransferase [Parastagonospora nodorum]KAH4800110.1 histone-lysine N-methyltransferase [Parastagonospora nodorum]KAH6015949.1 histone-lysine N-methyltransferase [Parastagonospora nodorum]KAH6047668.1 histone-lysine N-methyltransferase [Parastagonospora nodorum]
MFMNPNKPKIRTKTVTVKKPAPATAASSPRTPSTAQSRPALPINSRSFSGPPANRYKVTSSASASASAQTKPREPARRSLAVSHVQKRKVSPSTPQWASSDDESEEEDDRLGKRRKTRPASNSSEPMNLNRTLEPDLSRRIRIQEPETNGESNGTSDKTLENGASSGKKTGAKRGSLLQGMMMSRGDEAKNYKAAFTGCEKNPILELQYPSPTRPERFEAVHPLDAQEGYSPLEDIYFSIEEIIQHYLPTDLGNELSSDTEGTVRLLKRAVSKNSPDDFKTELAKFNALIKDKLSDGTIQRIMDEMHAIPLSLVKRITAQSYNRIVSPQAHRLRKVKGKETTYGELLTPFVHKIFAQTGLNSSHVFVDLGSGVGNVVLQAALQTGAESWGIEKMELAASLGSKQASEIQARARLWNIHLGAIHLISGDFLETPEIDEVLRRADVVLVNNKVFGEKLNNDLLQKFLDLKDGCKVVSLESFGGGAKQGVRHEQAIAGLFDEERFESGTFSVSWVGESVEYYIATKAR